MRHINSAIDFRVLRAERCLVRNSTDGTAVSFPVIQLLKMAEGRLILSNNN